MRWRHGLLSLWMLLGALAASGQALQRLSGRLLDKQSGQPLRGVEVLFRNGSDTFRAITLGEGRFALLLPPATYTVELNRFDFSAEVHRDVVISASDSVLTLVYLAACPFYHPTNWLPTCPAGHRDYLVPIVYGLPDSRLSRQAKAGKVRLGGCMVSDCSPAYYCPVHDKEL